ncbi:MAG: DegV family protein [Clostridiales bacterium]|nr:DegV family protein [Clostridiales bacterium]
MKDFVITADSNCDLPEQYIKENHIGIIPHYYVLEDITYGDEVNLSPKEFYDIMRAGQMPTTIASNPEVIRTTFQKYIDRGLDILHISFSSALSGGYSNVVTGAQEICEENPGSKIVVFDTLNVSLGEGMFIMKAVRMREEGRSIDEVVKWLEEHKQEFCVRFTVNDLFHLHRGGRISKTTAIVGSMLNIKPVLYVNPEGQLVALKSIRGRKNALSALCDEMMDSIGKYRDTDDPVCILHGDADEDAKYLENRIRELLPEKKLIINYVSPSIGAHSGPGAIGLIFMGEER